ncbi:MAG: hypothetical protein SFU27_07055 [Thermonemataceae bacterium]|nr:hypothetical protein [Thermonemataceae bacterium]
MKKIILITAIYLSFVAGSYAQTHSDLWYKVDSLKQALYPELYNNPVHINSKNRVFSNHPCIVIDRKKGWQNKDGNYVLDSYQLSQIAGIIYYPIGDPFAKALFPGNGATIEIFTHDFVREHPTITREFKITFPAPSTELPENKNNKKK